MFVDSSRQTSFLEQERRRDAVSLPTGRKTEASIVGRMLTQLLYCSA